ncbi:MAG: DNA repair protein RecO [Polyangiaceae bacterium]|nr:DNA repair protein RecO [Polyangiaceae bacterium]
MSQRIAQNVNALGLTRIPYAEADLIVHLFSDSLGCFAGIARGLRKNPKRFGGSLEPFHTLQLSITERATGDLATIKESQLLHPRSGITADLERMKAAAQAMLWIKKTLPPRQPEPLVWLAAQDLLERLSAPNHGEELSLQDYQTALARFGLRLLDSLGFALELRHCVSCRRACPEARSAYLNPERGGLICRACGSGPLLLQSEFRRQLQLAQQGDLIEKFEDAALALEIVDRTIQAHAGFSPKKKSHKKQFQP